MIWFAMLCVILIEFSLEMKASFRASRQLEEKTGK
jgi:hypothetical protein